MQTNTEHTAETVKQRVTELLGHAYSGPQIASTMKQQGFTPDHVEEALLENRFSVQRKLPGWGIVLHISHKPVTCKCSLRVALSGASGEVAWNFEQFPELRSNV